jgi:hypothetical protein
MIEIPTVLILGAGASIPFGFPSGKELKDKICKVLCSPTRNTKLHQDYAMMDIDEQIIVDFGKQLRYSGLLSVDAFLERNDRFLRIGKYAIARALLPFERTDDLFKSRTENWYEYLFNKLNNDLDNFQKNKLSIITFNYDRSLEQYLYTAFQNAFGIEPNDAVELLKQIPIIHLYGQLGQLPIIDNTNGIQYGVDMNNFTLINRAANGIKIISEVNERDKQFFDAYRLLEKARRIYFIGFGYNRVNLDRLELRCISKDCIMKGTRCGLSEQESKDIIKYIKTKSIRTILLLPGMDAMKFIREIPLG